MRSASNEVLAIEVERLRRSYRDGKRYFEAVRGIDLQVHRGEAVGLLGTNGAGKTSTMDVLVGLSAPTSGKVRVFGLDPIADRDRIRPRLGVMLQEGGLPAALRVGETIDMWAATCSNPMEPAQSLEEVGLERRVDSQVGTLSGGEARRLDLACVLVGQPELLILDEPTAGLDTESRARIAALLEAKRAQGLTLLLSTHYLPEAERLCDRFYILHRGEIALRGTLHELSDQCEGRIEFADPGVECPQVSGTTWERRGGVVQYKTRRLQSAALSLLAWAEEQGVLLERLTVSAPSLEEAFLDVAHEREMGVK